MQDLPQKSSQEINSEGTEQVADIELPKEIKEKNDKVGRPLKFQTKEELQEKIDAYYKSCWTQKIDMFGNPIFEKDKNGNKTDKPVLIQFKPYTITGLAVFLDTSRETLINYQEREEFFDAIKRAKEKCHAFAEESLFVGKNPSGAIFNLKNNYGWKDKNETDITTKGESLNNMSYERAKGIITGGKGSDKSNSPE